MTERPANESWTHSAELQAIVDFGGTFRAANPAWLRVLGYALDELVGHAFLEFVLRDDVVFARPGFDEIVSGANLRAFENCVVRRDGQLCWISWNAWIEHDLVYLSGRDVTAEKIGTARRLATTGLRRILEAEGGYQALVSPQGFMIGSTSSSLFAASIALADVVGKPLWVAPWFSANQQLAEFVKGSVHAAAAGALIQRQVEMVLAGGKHRLLDFALRPIRGDDGNVEGLLNTVVNGTGRRLD